MGPGAPDRPDMGALLPSRLPGALEAAEWRVLQWRKRGEAEKLCSLSPLHVEPFEIAIPERTLSDLRERIGNTRWPPPSPEPGVKSQEVV